MYLTRPGGWGSYAPLVDLSICHQAGTELIKSP